MTTISKFVVQEVAYRIPGSEWKRKVCKTERAFDKLLEKLGEQGAEIQVRDLEVSQ